MTNSEKNLNSPLPLAWCDMYMSGVAKGAMGACPPPPS